MDCDCTTSIYTEHCSPTIKLQTFYLIGSVFTILGTLFVFYSYLFTPSLRQYPSVIIFYRCLTDFGLGLCLIVSIIVYDHYDIICNKAICHNIGHLIYFLLFSSVQYSILLLNDLRIAITNPFSSPYKRSVIQTNSVIFLISGIVSSLIRLTVNYEYKSDIQICSITEHKNATESIIDPNYAIFLFVPLLFVALFAIYVTISAFSRLRKGLPNTFNIRKKAIRAAWTYCILYAIYLLILTFFYLMTFIEQYKNKVDDNDYNYDENIFYKGLAFTFSSFGITDFIVFLLINYDKYKKCIADEPCTNIRNKYGISVINDSKKRKQTINEALMLEVLAYTTDGIAQAVDRVQNCNAPNMFPQNYKDYRENVVNKFKVMIEHNWAVTLRKRRHHNISQTVKLNKYCCWMQSLSSISSNNRELIAMDLVSINDNNVMEKYQETDAGRYNDNSVYIREEDTNKYSQKREFIDFAPLVFKYIRNKIIGIDDNKYKASIIPKKQKDQLKVLKNTSCGEGKSGAFFYVSHDNKFIVKTISKNELKKLISILADYKQHLERNRKTIFSRFVGLHGINIYGLTQYFVVMENVFIPNLNCKPNEVYDLKGSWIRRSTNYRVDSGVTMLDLDFRRNIIVNEMCKENVLKQLNMDSKFLCAHNIVDYSLLLGIYYVRIEYYDDNVMNDGYQSGGELIDLIVNEGDEKNEKVGSEKYDLSIRIVRSNVIEGPGIYAFGIIDILQDYNWKKKFETWFKTYIKCEDKQGLSVVEPEMYQRRFLEFLKEKIKSNSEYLKKNQNKFPTNQLMHNRFLYHK